MLIPSFSSPFHFCSATHVQCINLNQSSTMQDASVNFFFINIMYLHMHYIKYMRTYEKKFGDLKKIEDHASSLIFVV